MLKKSVDNKRIKNYSACTELSIHKTNIENRGSYMPAQVLLNLLNELGKIYKVRGLPSILSLFCNKFNKCNKQEHGR